MRRTNQLLAACVSLTVLAALSACASEQPASDSPYAAQFEQARSDAPTDFQRQILQDDVISDDEYRETRQHYVDCLEDAGIEAKMLDNGGYDIYADLSGKKGDIDLKCARETVMSIEPLYNAVRVNPKNENYSVLVVNCLVENGVVEADFTKDDWDSFISAFAAVAGDGSQAAPAKSELPTLPNGTPMDDPLLQACYTDPLGQ